MDTQPVLVVEHEAQCPPGWFGEWLVETGATLDVRRPYRGDPLPEDLAGHAALVLMGGSMSAYSDEQHPWLAPAKELVRTAQADGTPTLGICLGHQLIAVALGGSVEVNPRGQQIGVLPMGWTPAAYDDALFGDLVDVAVGVQWNNDVLRDLPPGAEVMARTGAGEVQAVRFGPATWGVQSHPEVGEHIVRAWADNDRDHCLERGIDVDEYVGHVAAARAELRAGWQKLAAGLVSITRERVPAR